MVGRTTQEDPVFAGTAPIALSGAMAGVLGRLLLFEPNPEMIDTFLSSGVLQQDALFANSHMQQGIRLLASFAETWTKAQTRLLLEDYTRLFIGLERILAPPFESVYRSREHLLFEQQTAEVREHYRRFRMEVPLRNRIPDDHIGYELQFLSELCFALDMAIREGKTAAGERYAQEIGDFITMHVSVWLPAFMQRVEKHAETAFYSGIVLLVSGLTEKMLAEAASHGGAAAPR